jgi:hypothetical protein
MTSAELRVAIRAFLDANTGHYTVKRPPPGELSPYSALPTVSGVWNFAERSGTSLETAINPDEGRYRASVVFLRSANYRQFLFLRDEYDPNCFWARFPTPDYVLLPASVMVVLDARSTESGIDMSLGYVLRALGLADVVLEDVVDQVRVGVTLRERRGMIRGWSVSSTSLISALQDSQVPIATALAVGGVLRRASEDGVWTVRFTHIGDPVHVEIPPLVDPSDPRCAS